MNDITNFKYFTFATSTLPSPSRRLPTSRSLSISLVSCNHSSFFPPCSRSSGELMRAPHQDYSTEKWKLISLSQRTPPRPSLHLGFANQLTHRPSLHFQSNYHYLDDRIRRPRHVRSLSVFPCPCVHVLPEAHLRTDLVNPSFRNTFALRNNVQASDGTISLTLPVVPTG